MKRLIFFLFAFVLFSFSDNTVTLKRDKIEQSKEIIKGIGKYIDETNLPHQEVIQIEKQLKTVFDNLSDSSK